MNTEQNRIVAQHRSATCVPKGTRSCDCTSRIVRAGWNQELPLLWTGRLGQNRVLKDMGPY